MGRWLLAAGRWPLAVFHRSRRGDRPPVRGDGPPPRWLERGAPAASGQQPAASAARVLWVARVLVIGLTVALLALLGRVVQLQVDPPPRIAQLKGTQIDTQSMLARRGAIVDRRGRVLAATHLAHRLFVDPMLIDDRGTFSERVGHDLNINPVSVEKDLSARPDSRYVVIDRRMTDAQLAAFNQADLPGLATDAYLIRDYPQGDLAGPLLGFVGVEGKGLDGLELAWNKRLTGEPGAYTVLRDARRRAMWLTGDVYRAPQPGRTLRLTLDATIQSIAQTELAKAVEHFKAKSGELVVMDPFTGQILAMANCPTYDPNGYAQAPADARRNRVVTDVFEPGSIFKTVVWAAETQAGYADPKEKIDTTKAGWWKPEHGPVLRDAEGHGTLTWEGVLIESSNIGMGKVSQRVGLDKLYAMIRRFGFGQPTGSHLPGEVGGILRPLDKLSLTALTRLPMGQGIAVTPLQMVRAFSAIANGGVLVTPRMTFADEDRMPLIDQRVLSPQIASLTRRVLRRVVTEGTGRKAKSDLYSIFGKTGTAQLPDLVHGGYYQDRYVSFFVGAAPMERPVVVVGCFIQQPDKKIGHYGGLVSAPVVKSVMEQTLLYLGVPPDQSGAADASVATTMVSERDVRE